MYFDLQGPGERFNKAVESYLIPIPITRFGKNESCCNRSNKRLILSTTALTISAHGIKTGMTTSQLHRKRTEGGDIHYSIIVNILIIYFAKVINTNQLPDYKHHPGLLFNLNCNMRLILHRRLIMDAPLISDLRSGNRW